MQTTPASGRAEPRESTPSKSGAPRREEPLTLARLAAMTVAEANDVYLGGWLPESLAALDGAPRGRMLAVAGLDRGPVADVLRRFAGAARFPWAGKSFHSRSAGEGAGINRIRLAGDREWYPFQTRIEPSAIDGAPCILLDYDLPENPWFIRKIRDELREVAPNLFLGPAMWKTATEPKLVLWFAIDKTVA